MIAGDTLTGALARAAGNNVGTYAISKGALANPNYAITFFPANLTITARPITVTAVTSTKVYNGTTASAGVPTITSGSLAIGDTATWTQTFDTATVGTNKVLTPSGTVTDGNGGLNYSVTFATVGTGIITQATPVITWPTPNDLPIVSALSATQLNAAASVPGTFAYTVTIPPAGPAPVTSGYVFAAGGTYLLSTTFTPTDAVNYTTATASVSLNVINGLATPVIVWNNPANITHPTPLGPTQLNATVAGVPGTLTYSPVSGTVLTAGPHSLMVTFTPADPTLYNSAQKQVTISVLKATPTITWATPASIVYGTALSSTQLNASSGGVAGTFSYSPIAGTILNVGAAQILSVTFTPTDTANYNSAVGSTTITVTKATPVITWANPADIVVGTALSTTQLNATVAGGIAGNFVYSLADGTTPALGAVLNVGVNQTLNVTFTPTGADAANYNSATGTAAINVTKYPTTVTVVSSVNPASNGQSITFTSIVASTYPGTPTGTVTFRDGAATIGSGPVTITGNTAALTITLTAGNHDITGTYNGDANFATSMSSVLTQIVNAPAGGGGGGGGGFGSQLVGINLSGTSPFMDGNGKSLTAGVLKTPDGKLTLNVPVGVFIWNAAGAAQSFLSANTIETPPAAPAPQVLIMAYELGTTGVTFNPGIGIAFNYTDAQLPAGVSESSLYIAWWNGSAWVKLTSSVDAAANSVSATITHFTTHFTTFALIGQVQPTATTTPPPTQTTTPPPSQTTTPPPSQTTTPPPGSTTTTTLPPVGGTTTNWLLIGGIIAAALVLGLAIFLMSRSRKTTV